MQTSALRSGPNQCKKRTVTVLPGKQKFPDFSFWRRRLRCSFLLYGAVLINVKRERSLCCQENNDFRVSGF
ncbi:hypothetical protein HMPREF9104_03361 [Lentilactobacillus kisonensis F0435]|uniref:Uncharacterized protein n=1 Tax=Lentilactobacillus kisonensis F0435 TaxID=797516 RepID=H1LL53_9LACO|nr:hypothetical protein HMPREF9104_03361 [Lentilactobacillus kisonensis F0435]